MRQKAPITDWTFGIWNERPAASTASRPRPGSCGPSGACGMTGRRRRSGVRQGSASATSGTGARTVVIPRPRLASSIQGIRRSTLAPPPGISVSTRRPRSPNTACNRSRTLAMPTARSVVPGREPTCLLVSPLWTDFGRSTPWRPGWERRGWRWSDREPLGSTGPERSLVATVFSYDLNGYTSVRARKTSTGAGKDARFYRRH